MFKTERNIQYSELEKDGRIGICTILNYFQDVSTEHTEKLGYGMTRLSKEGLAWIMRTINASVRRFPHFGEKLKIYTWTTGFEKMFGKRSFMAKDECGETVATAASLWALVDTKQEKPVRVNDEIIRLYGIEENTVEEYIRREPDTGEVALAGEYTVQRRDIDTNNHVNNVKFVEIASEFLPEGIKIKSLQAFYRRAAYLGDVIYAHICENTMGIRLKTGAGETHTVMRFTV